MQLTTLQATHSGGGANYQHSFTFIHWALTPGAFTSHKDRPRVDLLCVCLALRLLLCWGVRDNGLAGAASLIFASDVRSYSSGWR